MRENLPEVLPPFPDTIIRPKQKRKPTVVSPTLREAADHIKRYGFSIYWGSAHGPACFVGSIYTALESAGQSNRKREAALNFLGKTIFGDDARNQNFTAAGYLARHKWNTVDAVAALEIAADIAECEGR